MGKKPNMSSKHQAPDQPVPGGEKGRQSVVDTRASSVEGPEPGAAPQETADPELQAAREDAQAMFARYQRLAADFENYKRRTRQELADRTQYANEELLRKLLPILDSFRRALDHAPDGIDPNWFEGIKMLARQIEDTLQDHRLTTIPAGGEKFDPRQRHAIARQESSDNADD